MDLEMARELYEMLWRMKDEAEAEFAQKKIEFVRARERRDCLERALEMMGRPKAMSRRVPVVTEN
jgi:hypothetical protein